MGSWSEQQEVKKEVKEKEKTSRETLGKFFYDLAKISFTALVVGKCCFCCDTTRKSRKLGTYTYRYFCYLYIFIHRL